MGGVAPSPSPSEFAAGLFRVPPLVLRIHGIAAGLFRVPPLAMHGFAAGYFRTPPLAQTDPDAALPQGLEPCPAGAGGGAAFGCPLGISSGNSSISSSPQMLLRLRLVGNGIFVPTVPSLLRAAIVEVRGKAIAVAHKAAVQVARQGVAGARARGGDAAAYEFMSCRCTLQNCKRSGAAMTTRLRLLGP